MEGYYSEIGARGSGSAVGGRRSAVGYNRKPGVQEKTTIS
jgi:hypothetical protein